MSALREEIRSILREELAALDDRADGEAPTVERVSLGSGADLDRFVRSLLARAASPGFVERVSSGRHRFVLAESAAEAFVPVKGAANARSGPAPTGDAPFPSVGNATPLSDKTLITERDIAALAPSTRSLRLDRRARLTPLARDEARRRGIRIDRSVA